MEKKIVMDQGRQERVISGVAKSVPEDEQAFIQFIRRRTGAPAATQQQAQQCEAARRRFLSILKEISDFEQPPYSVWACVMKLPPVLPAHVEKNLFAHWLGMLLSDEGIYFEETFPLGAEQLSARDRVASLQGGDIIYQFAAADESTLLSALTGWIEVRSRSQEGLPLQQMEAKFGKDLFRRIAASTLDYGGQKKLVEYWKRILKENFNLSQRELALEIEGHTLDEVLQKMAEICEEYRTKQTLALRSYEPTISREVYARYCKMKRACDKRFINKELLACWDRPLMIQCSANLADILTAQVRDTEACTKRCQKILRSVQITRPKQSDSEPDKVFLCDELGDVEYLEIQKLCGALSDIFFDTFHKAADSGVIEAILTFSCSDMFCLEDSINAESLPLAPIITYMIFQNVARGIQSGKLTRIQFDKLFEKKSNMGFQTAYTLFQNISHVYEELYQRVYTDEFRRGWEIVFSTLSGFREERVSSKSGKETYLNPCYGRAAHCLNIHSPQLLHDSVTHRKFSPAMLDSRETILAANALQSQIEEQELWEPLLANYCDELWYPRSDLHMRGFLERALSETMCIINADQRQNEPPVQADAKRMGQLCREFCVKNDLRDVFVGISPQTTCEIILEWAMHRELCARCKERIEGWLEQVLQWKYETQL